MADKLLAQCDSTKRPIVFVHGFLASGDTYSGQIKRFKEAGYCADRLFVFDWNSVNGNGKKNDSLFSNFVEMVLAKTGSSQIDLVGHSAGGGLARGYLIDSAHAAKAAHYIHLGSRKWYTPLPWFANDKCLNIFSAADRIMGTAGGVVEGAHNLDLIDKDHYEVATSRETFQAMFSFLYAGERKKEELIIKVVSSNPFEISGKALYLGDNSAMKNARLNIYRVNIRTGNRIGPEPDRSFVTDSLGYWGPYRKAAAGDNYEMELIPAGKEQRTLSYFFEPMNTADNNIYLRGFPAGNAIAAMLGNLPQNKEQSVIVIYSASRAIIAGRDSVTVNGIPVSSLVLTPAGKTVISSFIFDDGDGKSSGKALKQFGNTPFLGGVDISLPAGAGKSHTVYYNGRSIALPAASSKDRIMIAVFN
jgi:hypothetical protein